MASGDLLPKVEATHDTAHFCSGADEIDDWLRRWGVTGQEVGNATVFAYVHENRVLGYHALAAAGVERAAAPGPSRRNAPNPVPILLLARLAVDRAAHGRGIGRALVRDALLRSVNVSEQVGFRALLVHCRDEQARAFYESVVPDFIESPTESLHLFLPLNRLWAFVNT